MGEVAVTDCRVIHISKVRMNPYVHLLQQALGELGISCAIADGLSPRLVQAWRGAENRPLQGPVDIVHLHWPELLYASPSPNRNRGQGLRSAPFGGLGRSVRLLATVLAGLVWAKVRGLKIVYTVHNLNPHEQPFPFLDRVANRALFALADAVHVHDEEARLTIAGNYGRHRRVYVVPHGSYLGAYPNDCTQQEARDRLGLPEDAFVYLFLGQVRRYKGIEDLIVAFRRLANGAGPECNRRSCRLVLAGNVHDAAYGRELEKLVHEEETRITTRFQYVPDSELQYFMNACDVCVLPYRDVTTSGAAILAFSFGKPIIAPALGGFTGLAAEGRGIVYDPASADGLLQALQQACGMDMESAEQRAMAWARQHEWRALAPSFVRIYLDVLGRG